MSLAVYLDANIFIAAFETSDLVSDHVWRVLDAVNSGSIAAVTSELTLAEVLPKPLASKNQELVGLYSSLIETGKSLEVIPVTRAILIRAAQIRAENAKVRLPDAIHLATALEKQCPALLTSDLRMRVPSGVTLIHINATSLDDIQALTR